MWRGMVRDRQPRRDLRDGCCRASKSSQDRSKALPLETSDVAWEVGPGCLGGHAPFVPGSRRLRHCVNCCGGEAAASGRRLLMGGIHHCQTQFFEMTRFEEALAAVDCWAAREAETQERAPPGGLPGETGGGMLLRLLLHHPQQSKRLPSSCAFSGWSLQSVRPAAYLDRQPAAGAHAAGGCGGGCVGTAGRAFRSPLSYVCWIGGQLMGGGAVGGGG